jgi:two-component system response regulator HydG
VKGRILLVDDEPAVRDLLSEELTLEDFHVQTCATAEQALDLVRTSDVDVVITDLNLRGGMSGHELCARVRESLPDLPVVVITAFGSLDTAVGAIRAGAYDFVTKPFDAASLVVVLDRALQHRALRLEVKRLTLAVEDGKHFEDITGQSRPMQTLFSLLAQVADSEVSVLIRGESGTGKELVARAIHKRSRRRDGPFVAINCSAVPETLLESQLFGHVKGAFTDAKSSRPGLFVQADKGTLFLDEIGDMPIALQPKLLRALQERCVLPVGGDKEIPFDVRVIAATHRDLEDAIRDGRFREDLFYRLNVVETDLPPLRERGADVLLLAQRFLETFAVKNHKAVKGIATPAAEKLLAYTWPGNVRELQNCMERAVALTRHDHITVEDLPEKVRSHKATRIVVDADDPASFVTLEELERRYILKVLEASGGARKKAAHVLGVDRKTLYRKLVRYGVASENEDESERG